MSWRCSQSSSSPTTSSGCSSTGPTSVVVETCFPDSDDTSESCAGFDGLHVAAEGMTTVDSDNTTPCVAKAASASIAAAAMARALSSLNCFRSARRFAVTSSAVMPARNFF